MSSLVRRDWHILFCLRLLPLDFLKSLAIKIKLHAHNLMEGFGVDNAYLYL